MANNISCDAHDYFEIVCMRQSHVIVISKKHEKYTGIAAGIKLINKQEYLKIDNGINSELILLTEVKKLEARNNPIEQHNFTVIWQ